MQPYKHLTLDQRCEIYGLHKAGLCNSAIAKRLGVARSTIHREMKWNMGQRGYRPQQAQRKATERLKKPRRARKMIPDVQNEVELCLCQDFSPEQTSGHLKRIKGISISHETIYQHVWHDKKQGGTLYRHLRCFRKKKRKRYGSYDRRGHIPNRVFIDERPSVVDEKARIGDWEADLIIGKAHKKALVTVVERKTKFTLIEHISSKTADNVEQALIRLLEPYQQQVHTITVDNGKEFTNHQAIASKLGATIYFAHPYHSWERGLNENTNGLVRQYFPKNEPLEQPSLDKVKSIQDRLNKRPRKTLDFKTPYELFFKELPSGALRN